MQKINRNVLLQALELISPGLSTRDVVSQANSYCFQDNTVYCFDDEICLLMPSPLDITGAVPAEPLKNLLSKMQEDIIEMEMEQGKLHIKGKGQSAWILTEEKIELPIENLEVPKKWKKLPDEFSNALKLVINCAGRDEARFELTCIHIHPDWVQAFDTYQFARYNIQLGIKKETLVRQVSIKNIVNLEMSEYAETDQWLHFKNSAGLIFACRRFTDKYPPLDNIANVTGKKIQLPKGLIKTTDRAEVFSVKSDKENTVRVDLKPGWVKVTGEGQYGSYNGRRKIKYSGPSLSFSTHPQMLIELVKNHSEAEVCSGEIMALKASIGNFRYVTSLSEIPDEKPKVVVKKKVKKKKVTV